MISKGRRFRTDVSATRSSIGRLGMIGAVLVLGLRPAVAQNGVTCTTAVVVAPTMRAEGLSDLVGDIVLNCSGSPPSMAQFKVSLNAPVTSRVLSQTSPTASQVDALLLVNDPQPTSQAYGTGPADNVIPGTVFATDPKTVTFTATLPSGPTATLRFTDIRVNASALTPGANVTAAISGFGISGSATTPIQITNPTQVVAIVKPGLTLGSSPPLFNFLQCQGQNTDPSSGLVINGVMDFSVLAKPRFDPAVSPSPDANTPAPFVPQNIPGTAYNSESGFSTLSGSPTIPPGLADFGTRLKVIFSNIPSNVAIFTPVIVNTPTSGVFLRLIDSGSGNSGPFDSVPPTDRVFFNYNYFDPPNNGAARLQSGAAVYEFVATKPAGANDIFSVKLPFAVSYAASNAALPGTSLISISYAPAATSTGTGATLPVPRFALSAPTSSALGEIAFTACAGAQAFTSVNGGSFSANVGVAPGSIASGFPAGLITSLPPFTAGTIPLPTAGDNLSVQVQDSGGTQALVESGLFYVSGAQINYLVPEALALGPGIVRVLDGTTVVAIGTLDIEAVAPGLFAASGIAAGQAITVKPDGTQAAEALSFLDSSGALVPTPIDLSSSANQVFLTLYATGIRGDSNLSDFSLTIGSASVPVTFAGAQGGFVGLDQVNAGPLPQSLKGTGRQPLALTVRGVASPNSPVALFQ